MKKVLSIVLSIAMVVCLAPTMAFAATTGAQADAAYSDTKGTACEGAVNVLSALGVVDGFTDGTYKPEQVVTRAQMAKLIITALGVADYASAKTSKFTDMSAATWAIPYVEYASNLNIVNGVGNNKFNPNGNVTYEQAATMIVRALGYTDKCNEMNGTWPAIYIQKATALGLFNDVVNKGTTGATRGDLAIMLYNALTVDEVYADNDGATQPKKGANGDGVTMMDTLNVNGDHSYKIVTDTDVENAVNSISGYVGAAAEVITNKDGDVLALSDIKTTFLTGDYKANDKFEADNGTTYTIASDAYKTFDNTKTGTVKKAADGVPTVNNNISSDNPKKFDEADKNNTFTIATTISGKTITGIYSIATWDVKSAQAKKVDSNDINQITKNKKLLSVKFSLNDDQEIDNGSYILNGVSSLSDIKADNIVYVYEGKNEITRVDVGTKTVTGTISKTTSEKVTIDGTAYKIADVKKDSLSAGSDDLKAGNKVTLYLDYDGKIFDTDLVDGSAGNFAVVIDKSGTPLGSAVASVAKIQLLTADGAKVFEVAGKKFEDNVKDNKSLDWNSVEKEKVYQYSVNDSGQITKIEAIDDDYTASGILATTAAKKYSVSKAGYIDGHNISDSAVIFTAPTDSAVTKFDYSDTDDLSVVKKANVLDTDVSLVYYIVDNDTNKVVFMIIDDSSTSDDAYGIVTSTYALDGNKGADFYVGSEKINDAIIDDNSKVTPNTVKEHAGLYKIEKTTTGSYKFTVESVKDSITFGSTDKHNVTLKNDYVQLSDTNTTKYNIYSKVIVYVYNSTDDEYSIGSTSDLTDDDVTSIKLYQTSTDSSDDDYGLINYIVIEME